MRQRCFCILSRVLKYTLLSGALAYLLIYLLVASGRISYPYELEWMEGGSVDHVRRILSGLRLYAEPSLEFTAFIYTPLYFYISAGVAKLFGVGFTALRLVSLLSSIGCMVIIFKFVNRQTNSLICGILSAGLYAATYKISGAWFDVGRVDSLFMFFLLGGVYFLRFGQNVRALVFAGLLVSLSFLTKQTAVFIAIPLSLYSLLCIRGCNRFVFPATFLLIVALTTVVLGRLTDGWYYYYIIDLPRQHPVFKYMLIDFWGRDLAKPLPIATGLTLCYLFFHLFKKRYKDILFFILLFTGMVGASWFSRLHSGGYKNVLFPAYAVIAIFFGIEIHCLLPGIMANLSRKKNETKNKNNLSEAQHSKTYELCMLLICIIQFAMLFYPPLDQLPSKADSKAGDAFISLLKDTKGEVFVPYHGFLPVLAGKKTYSHTMAMHDVLRSRKSDIRRKFHDTVSRAIRNKQFEIIILDEPWFIEDIKENYFLSGTVFANDDVFYPVSGFKTRPELIYKLKE